MEKFNVRLIKNEDGYTVISKNIGINTSGGFTLSNRDYEALKHHFKTGAMEVSSDGNTALPLHIVTN